MPTIIVGRDDVHPADAYGEVRLRMSLEQPVAQLVERFIAGGNFLPGTLHNGMATWVLKGRVSVAVYAQQWEQPRYLVLRESPISSVIEPMGKPHFHFHCLGTADPVDVFESLRTGQPLPRG